MHPVRLNSRTSFALEFESFRAVAASKSTLVFIYRHWSDLFVYKFLEGNPDQWLKVKTSVDLLIVTSLKLELK